MNPHSRLSTAFLRNHPAAAARILEGFPAESTAKFLSAAAPTTAVHVIEYFTPGFAASSLLAIGLPAAGQIFTQLHVDHQIKILRQLDEDKRESYLGTLQPLQAASIRRQLPYSESTAGALMEAPLASVPEELPVRDALKRIKRIKRGMKFYIYAVNTKGQLAGVLTLHELINAQPANNISQVMHRHVVSLSPAQSVLTVFNSPDWQDYYALPVTDENNVLLGVIRNKDMRRFQEHSAHAGAVSTGLGAFISASELFSMIAGYLLAALISAGTSQTKRHRRG